MTATGPAAPVVPAAGTRRPAGPRGRRRGALLLAAGLTAAVTGCGSSGHSGASGASGAGAEAATGPADAQVLAVTGTGSLKFDHTALTAKVGTVRVDFTVTGGVPHNFTLNDGPTGASKTISTGTTPVTFHFTSPGTYHFVCTIHPDSMKGVLTVTS